MAAKYLTIVGQLQQLVTSGRLDLYAQVKTISKIQSCSWTRTFGQTQKSMPMPLGLRTMQLHLELINLTTPSYKIKILTGHILYMVCP